MKNHRLDRISDRIVRPFWISGLRTYSIFGPIVFRKEDRISEKAGYAADILLNMQQAIFSTKARILPSQKIVLWWTIKIIKDSVSVYRYPVRLDTGCPVRRDIWYPVGRDIGNPVKPDIWYPVRPDIWYPAKPSFRHPVRQPSGWITSQISIPYGVHLYTLHSTVLRQLHPLCVAPFD